MSTARKPAGRRRRPARRKRRSLLGYFRKTRSPLAWIGQIVGIVGAVSTVVGLVFVFNPGCRPQDVGTLKISDVRVIQPYTYRRYLQRQKLPVGTLSPQYLRRVGVLIEFHAAITGLRGKQLPLRWELNDAETNDLVSEDEAIRIKPSTNAEERNWFVWVPVPKTRRTYYVTVTIYQPPRKNVADVPLQAFDSPRFRGLAT